MSWHLTQRADGVIRINAVYFQIGTERADTWAIAYTTDESTPPANTPDITVAIPAGSMVKLAYDLPAQVNGTIVKVRLQTRRTNGATITYSSGSIVRTLAANAVGPTAPPDAELWAGPLPQGV